MTLDEQLQERSNGIQAGAPKPPTPRLGLLLHETVAGGETLIELRARVEKFP